MEAPVESSTTAPVVAVAPRDSETPPPPLSGQKTAAKLLEITGESQNPTNPVVSSQKWTQDEKTAFYALLRTHIDALKAGATTEHLNSAMETFSKKLAERAIHKTREQCRWQWYGTARHLKEFSDAPRSGASTIERSEFSEIEQDTDAVDQSFDEDFAKINEAAEGSLFGGARRWTEREHEKLEERVRARFDQEVDNPTLQKLNGHALMSLVSKQLKEMYSIDRSAAACEKRWRDLFAKQTTGHIQETDVQEGHMTEPKIVSKRVRFRPEQKEVLDHEAKANGLSPSTEAMKRIADELHVEVKKVKSWFSNARNGHFGYAKTVTLPSQHRTDLEGDITGEDTNFPAFSSNPPDIVASGKESSTAEIRKRRRFAKSTKNKSTDDKPTPLDTDDDDEPIVPIPWKRIRRSRDGLSSKFNLRQAFSKNERSQWLLPTYDKTWTLDHDSRLKLLNLYDENEDKVEFIPTKHFERVEYNKDSSKLVVHKGLATNPSDPDLQVYLEFSTPTQSTEFRDELEPHYKLKFISKDKGYLDKTFQSGAAGGVAAVAKPDNAFSRGGSVERSKTLQGKIIKKLGKRDPSLPLSTYQTGKEGATSNPTGKHTLEFRPSKLVLTTKPTVPSQTRHSTGRPEPLQPSGSQLIDNGNAWNQLTLVKIRDFEEDIASLKAQKEHILSEVSTDEAKCNDIHERVKKLQEQETALKEGIKVKKEKASGHDSQIEESEAKKKKLVDALAIYR